MRKLLSLGAVLAFVCGTAAFADTLKKGNMELSFAFSYDDLSPDSGEDAKTYNLDGAWGYLLTDRNELGATLSYAKVEGGGVSADAMRYGAFYNFNFAAGDMANPYIGAQIEGFSGDLSDFYDMSYGISGGVKFYPWANGGFNFGARYDWLTGADDFEDATDLRFFAGVNVKW